MISALYVRSDSIYYSLGIDCWDIIRDARTWQGGNAIIAHPPCRSWGQLSHFAKPRSDEKQLAIDCINLIRKFGGVLEHPRSSKLWDVMNLPKAGSIDEFEGYSICIDQNWFGHKAQKSTLLYIKGCPKNQLPAIPLCFDRIDYTVASSIKKKSGLRLKKEITKKEREATPLELAKWLIKVAEICDKNVNKANF